MKYEAMKHQGSKGEKHTADEVGEKAGDSGRTVQRYIRLASLIDGLFGSGRCWENGNDCRRKVVLSEKIRTGMGMESI